MAEDFSSNTYEEARQQRLLENKKRIEELGILKIAKSLTDATKSDKTQQRQAKPRASRFGIGDFEPRRSSRERSVVSSYRDDINVEHPSTRKRSKFNSSWTSYLARPVDEVKCATLEERNKALNCAEKLQSNLQSEYPFFIKSMVRSHVYSCFWLGLPSWFCQRHLPNSNGNIDIVLENETGAEYDAVYISKRSGLSGGWRAFALDLKLDDGDALVFELIKPTRLKVYIVKAGEDSNSEEDMSGVDEEDKSSKKKPKKITSKASEKTESKKGVNPVRVSSRKNKYDGSNLEDDNPNTDEEHKGPIETKTEEIKPKRVSSRKSSRK